MRSVVKIFLLATIMVSGTLAAYAADSLMKDAQATFKPIPAKAPVIAGNPPATPVKVELGKMLFFEPRLSKSGFISCNSCHNVGMGGDGLSADINRAWLETRTKKRSNCIKLCI